jgi:hypothetical protein
MMGIFTDVPCPLKLQGLRMYLSILARMPLCWLSLCVRSGSDMVAYPQELAGMGSHDFCCSNHFSIVTFVVETLQAVKT